MRWPGPKPSANLWEGRLRHPKPFQSIFFLSPFKGLHHHRNITRNSSRRISEKNKKHHFSQQLRRAPPPITASNTIITISHIALPAAFVSRLSLQSIVLCSRVPRPQLKLLRCCSAFVPELLATNLQPYCSLRPLTVPQLYLLPIRPTIDAPFAPLDLERQRRSTLSPVRSNSPHSRRRF